MVILRNQEIRDMPKGELEKKLDELRLTLSKEMSKINVGGIPENPGRVRIIKKTIAKILTIKNEKLKGVVKKNARNL